MIVPHKFHKLCRGIWQNLPRKNGALTVIVLFMAATCNRLYYARRIWVGRQQSLKFVNEWHLFSEVTVYLVLSFRSAMSM